LEPFINNKIEKKRGKKRQNYYFTDIHELAIIAYCKTSEQDVKEYLYNNFIESALSELVDKIVFTYKFTNISNIDELKKECKTWLLTILDKYDPSKGSKAFSYFSVVTRHWFGHQYKKNAKRNQKEVSIDSEYNIEDKLIITENEYEKNRENKEFWAAFYTQMEAWNKNLEADEKIVLDAIKILFESANDIEIFNKKAIYMYLREITGYNSKQIAPVLKKIRNDYKKFKESWLKSEINLSSS